ncbi:MAG: uncharacterized protein KVP18_004065 [Porospora cf. gigantea A]|uniref:uncharacterized protein n=1 Tax=Porospora cf. gigantea A TaxID=2853593 RepID=UPI003559AB53|nr:MAG: hypothetical protein KVP18_004065 [Porospora cf. gigantea A]
MEFGYWAIRGLGYTSRLLLDLSGQEWSEQSWTDMESWSAAKAENQWNLAVPNLPYLVDGDVRLSQSDAIEQYLLQKYLPHLLPSDPAVRAAGRMWQGIMRDVIMKVLGIIRYTEMTTERRLEQFEVYASKYQNAYGLRIDEQLTKSKFLLGDTFTFYDVQMLNALETLAPLDKRFTSQVTADYIDRIRCVPEVAKHYAGKNFIGRVHYEWPVSE